MAKTGRPKVEIDQSQFEKLCKMQCTLPEIAGWFSCSEDTVQRWCKRTYGGETFAVVFARLREGGKASLRATQFKLAQKSPAMAIFLGKNWLGQSDKIEQHVTVLDETAQEEIDRILWGDDGQDEG